MPQCPPPCRQRLNTLLLAANASMPSLLLVDTSSAPPRPSPRRGRGVYVSPPSASRISPCRGHGTLVLLSGSTTPFSLPQPWRPSPPCQLHHALLLTTAIAPSFSWPAPPRHYQRCVHDTLLLVGSTTPLSLLWTWRPSPGHGCGALLLLAGLATPFSLSHL
jgi:hypothetical protein